MSILKIRYALINQIINSLFLRFNINAYPVDLKKLFSYFKDKIRIVPYSKHMSVYNLTENEVIDHLGTEEGCTVYSKDNDKYLIFYNDLKSTYKSPERIRWTLSHELGHILLKHLKEIDGLKLFRNSISDNEYNRLEVEANRFAALLLANPIALTVIGVKSPSDIAQYCQLSISASNYRYNDYKKWYLNPHRHSSNDLKIFSNFHKNITCKFCRTELNPNYKYCPMCGDKFNIKRGIKKMIYNSIEINNKFKATKCPVCDNEMTDCDGEYCQICGTHIVNKCTNPSCNNYLSGEARFCPYCGSQSTFLVNNFLLPYIDDSSKQDYNDIFGQETYDNISDEMPF